MRKYNLNVPETMKIAGHSDPRMLLRIYNNLEAHHVAKKLNSSITDLTPSRFPWNP